MQFQFSHYKKEPDMQDLWNEFRKTFEQGVALADYRNSLPGAKGAFDKLNSDWVPKQEERMLEEAERGY